MTMTDHLSRLPRDTWLLALGQAFNLTSAVLMVTVGAVAGSLVASTAVAATLPYGIQFAVVMAATYPVSMLMKRHGRRPLFAAGCLALIGAGLAGWMAMQHVSLGLLVLAHALVGLYIATANFYRFAAVDKVASDLRPAAVSLVVAGGVLAAMAGPGIASAMRATDPGATGFGAVYGALAIIGGLNLALLAVWRPRADEPGPAPTPPGCAPPDAAPPSDNTATGRNMRLVALATLSASAAYLAMNLLMVQSSLVLKDLCTFSESSRAIQAHVVAMFVPSFFTGVLIDKLGVRRLIATGFLMVASAAVLGLMPSRYETTVAALILLGVGWNFAYVGGGVLLTQATAHADRHRWQGINDSVIAASATLGAFLPAPALATLGWQGTNAAVLGCCVLGLILARVLVAPARSASSPTASTNARA